MRVPPILLFGLGLASCGSGSGGPGGGPGAVDPPRTLHREEIRIVEPWAGVDAAGVRYVVWSNDAGVGFLVRFVPGQGWTTTETIPDTVAWDSLAVDEAGVLYAARDSSVAGQIALWGYEAATGWRELPPLPTATLGSPQLLASARGVSLIWVHARTTSLGEIWGARYHPDAGWSVPAVVNHAPQPSVRDIVSVSAAADPDGNVAALWNEETADGSTLLAADLPVGGSWSAPRVLLAPAGALSGGVAAATAGHALAAWEDQGMLNASWFDPGSGWGDPAPAIAAGWEQMKVSLDDGGRAFVSWMELSDDPTARAIGFKVLRGAAHDDGGGWRAAPLPDRHPAAPAQRPGSLNVFYATSTLGGAEGRGAVGATSGNGHEMYLVPYRHGAGGGAPLVLDVTLRALEEEGLPIDGVTVAFGRPQLVANRSGQAIMIWTMLRTGGPGLLRATAFDL